MRITYFTHSLRSCWNHGNAHFLRGVLRELQTLGHTVKAIEPEGSWSLANLLQEKGPEGLRAFEQAYPELRTHIHTYAVQADALAHLDGADLVLVHEWNDPTLVAAIGARRAAGGRFKLLFHDTHHRAVSDPQAIRHFDLSAYDGILAFGARLAEVYRAWGWRDVHVWHEAADARLFHPLPRDRDGAVWIGNWGDGERTQELQQYLFEPLHDLRVHLDVHGVRFPDAAKTMLARYGAHYHGWLANACVPDVFAAHQFTVHVPRRFYAQILPGIPTIRVFEALACGIPLLCAPWDDSEYLFAPGEDYLVARDSDEMRRHIRAVRQDANLRQSLIDSGLKRIKARHTCRHRAEELLAIVGGLEAPRLESLSA
jgi:spore maturation protein CgeB